MYEIIGKAECINGFLGKITEGKIYDVYKPFKTLTVDDYECILIMTDLGYLNFEYEDNFKFDKTK